MFVCLVSEVFRAAEEEVEDRHLKVRLGNYPLSRVEL